MPNNTKVTDKTKTHTDAPKAEPRDGRRTKADTILRLLRRPKGASLAQLQNATEWQAHSVRAALTGLRKRGHAVERTKDAKGVTRYRITK